MSTSLEDLLSDLTPEQRAAVEHRDGPVIVVAGPGSGKTRVITRRVAHLVRGGAPPWSILAITFTNKAAEEMRARIEKLLSFAGGEGGWRGGGGGGGGRPVVSTFHSFCARMLRRYGPEGRTNAFTIYDQDDQKSCVRKIIGELNLDDKQWKAGSVLARISDAKNKRLNAESYDAAAVSFVDRTVARVYRRYEEVLREYNALDFDDLLNAMVDVLERRDDVRVELRERFRYILVDEYQDTNRPQYEIANLLSGKDGNLCVVGDPDQSIYKWRGADIRNILEFEEDHPGARVIKLERNYRSTKRILAAAQGVIANNTERREKTLFTENDEGEPVRLVRCLNDDEEARVTANRVQDLIREEGVTPGEIAVFYRVAALSRKFEESLRFRGIKHVVIGDVPFFQRKEVKDALAFLRILANPSDEVSLKRAIALWEGFGAKTLEKIAAHAQATGRTLLDAVRTPEGVPDLGARQRKAVAGFAELLAGLRELPERPVGPLLDAVVDRTGERSRLRRSDDPQDRSRAENLDSLVTSGYEFDERAPEQDFRAFLDQASLLAATDQTADEGAVRLMTLHAAKGLEFDEVFIAGVDAGILPLERQLEDCDREEERRLFYVGITRARKRLTLTCCALRRTYGQEKPHRPSPFLREIPEEAIEMQGAGGLELDLDPTPRQAAAGARPRWRRGGEGDGGDDFDFPGEDTRFVDEQEGRGLGRRAPESGTGTGTKREGPAASKVQMGQGVLFAEESKPTATKAPEVRDRDLTAGDRVEHGVFGAGRVLEVQGDGIGRRVRVRFERIGDKLLVLHYANLRRVS